MPKRTCIVDGCFKKVKARQMCSRHYNSQRNHGDPLAVDRHSRPVPCAFCGETFARVRPRQKFCATECQIKDGIRRKQSQLEAIRRSTVLSCRQCGEGFFADKSLGQKYCSRSCARKWQDANNTKVCELDGCSGKLRARGMCASHYKEWYLEEFPEKDPNPKHEMQCAACGKSLWKVKSGPRVAVCSYECRYVVQHGRTKVEAESERARLRALRQQLVRRPHLRFRLVIKYAEPSYHSVRFTSVQCEPCGEYFVWDNRITGSCAKYCSDYCRNSALYARLTLRKRGFGYSGRSISPAVRRGVYERDGWVCQLCFEPVVETEKFGRWSPTLDHIIPQSMQLIPDHSPSNLRLAHNYCNAIRGDGNGTNLPAGRDALSA